MLTKDPKLIWNPLSEASTQPSIIPKLWIIHTAVDAPGPTNLHGYFEDHTSVESHTWLRWDKHEQFIPFNRSADANYKVNRFLDSGGEYYGAISTEIEDDGDPVGKPLNVYQVKELIRFGTDTIGRKLGIPAVLPPIWHASGMGYHSYYPGYWTNVPGKTCPGSTRIKQFKDIILPAIKFNLENGGTDVPDDQTIMMLTAILDTVSRVEDKIKEIAPFPAEAVARNTGQTVAGGTPMSPVSKWSLQTEIRGRRMEALLTLDNITKAVIAAIPATGIPNDELKELVREVINDEFGFLKPGV